MTLAITAVTPDTVPEDGGHEIEVSGTFVLNNRHRVHIGGQGNTNDPQCYSGKAGQGNIIYPRSTSVLRCYTPAGLTPGAAYDVTVVDLETAEEDNLADEVTIMERQFYSKTYAMRKPLPHFYKTGPRDIEKEPQ